jgi:hypothetical protein
MSWRVGGAVESDEGGWPMERKDDGRASAVERAAVEYGRGSAAAMHHAATLLSPCRGAAEWKSESRVFYIF